MSPKTDNVRCGYGWRLKPNRFLARGERKTSQGSSQNSVAEGRRGERLLFGGRWSAEAAWGSGLDQSQVAADRTMCWLCVTCTVHITLLLAALLILFTRWTPPNDRKETFPAVFWAQVCVPAQIWSRWVRPETQASDPGLRCSYK